MKAFQRLIQSGQRPRPQSWAMRVALCLVLVAFLAVVLVPHLHATQNDADHCPLCVLMHSTAPATVAVAVVVLVPLGTPAPQAEPATVVRKPQTRLFIRPPPSGC